ncbi:MAG TPA: AAA family ATPase [Ktedonobacteraceae bacterium]|nr:AAA family ATPase [Ktedonobacteraceae bacterium]
MNEDTDIPILPYTCIVGQEQLKLALELAYIAPSIGGVLISGEPGTGKSTTVRAFAKMMYEHLPVTIPINATEDRVVGGWNIDALMKAEPMWQEGLLEEADKKLLYIDEVNLLDDHIVNIILDVTSTGVLVVQREGKDEQKRIRFTLVGTMNPEEGGLRPQLLDRFGLLVQVAAEIERENRIKILQTVLDFDEAIFRRRNGQEEETLLEAAYGDLKRHRAKLEEARHNFYGVRVSDNIAEVCIKVTSAFQTEGHRGDYQMAFAARAYAAREGYKRVNLEHVKKVAPFVLQHRRPEAKQLNRILWTKAESNRLEELLHDVSS